MKHLTLIVTLCVMSTFAHAQVNDDISGIKGGVNFTNLYVDDVDDENMKIGFNVGVFHRAQVSEHFGIQPELLFTQKGSELHYDGGIVTGSGSYKFNMNYLELPVLFVGSFGNFNLHVGPYAGLLVGAKIKDVDDKGNVDDVEELDRDDFNTFDYGLAGGLGFDFPGGIFGLRYNYGFAEIGDEGIAGTVTRNSKNSALQIYIGFGM